jgi:hypothetical protein
MSYEGLGTYKHSIVVCISKCLTTSMDNFFYYPILSMGSFTTKGAQQTMEDTHFLIFQLGGVDYIFAFGVFDGHHGKFFP